ncbi:hypothetical protein [Thiococcus pfennigii]|nr:hypothetical protein [Thiococcus pfennigii]
MSKDLLIVMMAAWLILAVAMFSGPSQDWVPSHPTPPAAQAE